MTCQRLDIKLGIKKFPQVGLKRNFRYVILQKIYYLMTLKSTFFEFFRVQPIFELNLLD